MTDAGAPKSTVARHIVAPPPVILMSGVNRNVPIDESAWLVQQFEAHRAHLRRVAYRMLGSVSDVDDALQEPSVRRTRAATLGKAPLEAGLPATTPAPPPTPRRAGSGRDRSPVGALRFAR